MEEVEQHEEPDFDIAVESGVALGIAIMGISRVLTPSQSRRLRFLLARSAKRISSERPYVREILKTIAQGVARQSKRRRRWP